MKQHHVWSNEHVNRNHVGAYIYCACAMICALIWYSVYYTESQHNLIIHFFDVGQGDGIFFELPNRVQVLIDGGPGNGILSKLGNVMWFWDHTIDLVVLTHPHADHIDGLIDVLKRYDIGMVIESGAAYSTPDYDEWKRLIKQKNIPVVYARSGQSVMFSEHAMLRILSPQKEMAGTHLANIHDSMVVSKLLYGSTSVLFTGDAERPVEYQLMASGIPFAADVLKVGHHGSKTSTTQQFLEAVHPRFAVISAGRKNRYGHPYTDIVGRIQAFGIDFFRTDIHGDVEFMSDGQYIWKSN